MHRLRPSGILGLSAIVACVVLVGLAAPSNPGSARQSPGASPGASPEPGCQRQSAEELTPTVIPGATYAVSAARELPDLPDRHLWINRIVLVPGAEIPMTCYEAAILLTVEQGRFCLTMGFTGGTGDLTRGPAAGTPDPTRCQPGVGTGAGTPDVLLPTEQHTLYPGDVAYLNGMFFSLENITAAGEASFWLAALWEEDAGCSPRPCSSFPNG